MNNRGSRHIPRDAKSEVDEAVSGPREEFRHRVAKRAPAQAEGGALTQCRKVFWRAGITCQMGDKAYRLCDDLHFVGGALSQKASWIPR